MKMTNFKDLKNKWMKDPEFKKGYDSFELEFKLIEAIMDAEIKEGISRKQLAKKIGTSESSILRFELGISNPSLTFLKKLARALGLTLTVRV